MKKTITVIGCGYIGLPLTIELSKFYNVRAFDTDKIKIENLKKNIDLSNEISPTTLKKCNKKNIFTHSEKDIKNSDFYIIAVPTPVDKFNRPNLKNLKKATRIVSKSLKKKSIIIYESTVYPGCTRSVCIPIIERIRKFKINKEFFVGYSPERINPGDNKHNLINTVKIISATNRYSLKKIKELYSKIINAKLHIVDSIEIAEAAKVIENTQRDINIALMNEFKIIFDKMSLSSKKIFAAASTKWNFIKFNPGLVGGHCIGVDPYYLTFKSKQIGITPKVILSGRKINDNMSKYVFSKIINIKKNINNALFLGCTFKENISDIRNSKIFDLARLFKNNRIKFDIYDPVANIDSETRENFDFVDNIKNLKQYDVIIFANRHAVFLKNKIKSVIKKNINQKAIIIDLCDITEDLNIKSNYML